MFPLKGHLSCHFESKVLDIFVQSDNDMQGWPRRGKPCQYKTAESKRNIKIDIYNTSPVTVCFRFYL